jgi:uncharacterized protein (DUF1684 family)
MAHVRHETHAVLSLVLTLLVGLIGCSRGAPDDSKYLSEIARERLAKDAELARAANSPVLPADRERFVPLAYFPPDSKYAVPAAFEPEPPERRARVEMQTSANKPRLMERLGTLRFTLQGRALALTAFVEAGQPPDRLFVPFADLTSGKETYAAGRYLEILPERTGIYVVDFNRAYNPYCYYNPAYDCPFPPRENRLPIAISAGEKVR